ncbi:hypothetical protein AcV5_003854 [Taiwanofungus camphoratus]|nr:hypothetical protein AcV5_003854 [Antrodia cinnamomea]KAI0919392.1 hypothetical protein AcV7_006143 [Antrodia cinnamomea]
MGNLCCTFTLMSPDSSYIEQELIPSSNNRISLRRFSHRQSDVAAQLLCDLVPAVLGMAIQLSKEGTIDAVAFATESRIFLVVVDSHVATSTRPKCAGFAAVFANAACPLAGFGMARLALHIHRDLGYHSQAVELGTLFSVSTRKPWSPSRVVSERIYPDVNRHAIHALFYGHNERDTCMRAWISACVAERYIDDVRCAPQINTQYLRCQELQCLDKLVQNVELLEAKKPEQMENEFERIEMIDGNLCVHNSRYKTRLRRSEQTAIILDTTHGDSIVGQAVGAEGKRTKVQIVRGHLHGDVETVRVVGREELTNAEQAREEFLLLLLRGEASLDQSLFIRILWFPSTFASTISARGAYYQSTSFSHFNLNPSQEKVANAMVSDPGALVIAHGPPGTGKTTTISAAVHYWDHAGYPAWIVAQSNVGVKNIAKSFMKYGINFKVLVSKEFYVEWHEHIYEPIEHCLLRSDELFDDSTAVERKFGGSQIVLCTLSMLSNPALDECGIDAFEFMHLFHKFRNLEKLCFFGDPKQLPPYGRDAAPGLRTIFDFKHLRAHAHFLDTQYRMPIPIGEFISNEVYNGKLRSMHKTVDLSCLMFVDVKKGVEEQVGKSWVNKEEALTVVNLVRHYYRSQAFCIITPYDAQRGAIEMQLKAEGLHWECVYNVDSFQGHESPYVIVSTVRTTTPGFLKSLNRMNVMLTRCQSGMVIVTNRMFLRTRAGQDTLLGRLAQHWEDRQGVEATWTYSSLVADRRPDMPGVRGRTVPSPLARLVSSSRPQRLSTSSLTTGMQNMSLVHYTQRSASLHSLDDFPSLPNLTPITSTRPRLHILGTRTTASWQSICSSSSTSTLPGAKGLTPAHSPMESSANLDTFPALGPSANHGKLLGRWRNGSDPIRMWK